MRTWVFIGVFMLLYQQAVGKPLKGKEKAESTELIREKREGEDDDERSSEMQKFMLDLSSKEDMSRLSERFRSGTSQDVENDVEYRRLKRFSIHDDDNVVARKTMRIAKEKMLSTRTALDDYVSEDDNITYKSRRSEDSTRFGKGETTSKKLGKDNTNEEHEVDFIRMNTADGNTVGSDVNFYDEHDKDVNSHHIVGGSWELIHHLSTGSPPSITTATNNTTMHSEYLKDDDMAQYDSSDVTQYERAGKSRRKPRVSQVKVTRSVESQYEVREISEVDDPIERNSRDLTAEASNDSSTESLHEDKVEMMNTRAIKRDGYIGCFIDQHPKRDLKKMFTVNNLTPDSCRSVCKDKGHVYAGVQYGYLCHCGDEYGRYGEAEEHECDSACHGDEGKKCGGFWRNSVYASGLSDNEAEEFNHPIEDTANERETRSHIDRVIPLPKSEQEEVPVRQDITVYLRSETPKKNENPGSTQNVITKNVKAKAERPNGPVSNSKRTKIPAPKQVNQPKISVQNKVVNQPSNVQAKKRTDVRMPYLHPQTTQAEFVPSNVVLRTIKSSRKEKKYTGFVKLKQNWDDHLLNKRNPKTLILAGNIESAFAEMFANDPEFEKAEVLSLREASIRDYPDTVHKVLVEFALVFKKDAQKKESSLRNKVENSSRLGDMPVFADSLDVKEFKNEEDEENADEASPKEKRQDSVDAFLQEVFRQI